MIEWLRTGLEGIGWLAAIGILAGSLWEIAGLLHRMR